MQHRAEMLGGEVGDLVKPDDVRGDEGAAERRHAAGIGDAALSLHRRDMGIEPLLGGCVDHRADMGLDLAGVAEPEHAGGALDHLDHLVGDVLLHAPAG